MNEIERKIILAQHETFQTARLILRKITIDDAPDIFEYSRLENVAKLAGFKAFETLEETQNFVLNFFLAHRASSFAIVEPATGKVIGTIGLEPKGDMAEFGWSLHPDFWGQGLVPEAVACLRDFAFDELKLNVLIATHYAGNAQSDRVMQKIGMKKLGQIYTENAGKWQLSDYYALTREDYEKEQSNERN